MSWAHPEFGQVLASCSSDRIVHIYEEQVDGRSGVRTWKKQGRLVDSRDSVQDVEFAPRHLGLRLATCSLDGRVRIYESQDVMNLSVWPLVEEFEAARGGANCLSWNTSPFDPPMLCVASEKDVKLWEYSGGARKWSAVASLDGHTDQVHDVCWAPNLGRAYHLLATACKDGCVRIFKLSYNRATSTYTPALVAKLDHHRSEVWRVSWNVSGTILASTGDDGVSRLWKSDFNGTWHPILVAAATQPATTQTNANSNTNNTQTISPPTNSSQSFLPSSTVPTTSSSSSGVSVSGGGVGHLNRLQSAPSLAAAAQQSTPAAPFKSNADELGTSFASHRAFN